MRPFVFQNWRKVGKSTQTKIRDRMVYRAAAREIDRTELYFADEAFLCGTGAQVAAVSSLDHRAIGSGEMGPITKAIRDLYFRVVRGQEAKYMHWLTPVPQTVPA